jgi:hypothetical protein
MNPTVRAAVKHTVMLFVSHEINTLAFEQAVKKLSKKMKKILFPSIMHRRPTKKWHEQTDSAPV